jgi:hypothetical protein
MDAHGVLGREQRVFVLSSISWVGLTTVTRRGVARPSQVSGGDPPGPPSR